MAYFDTCTVALQLMNPLLHIRYGSQNFFRRAASERKSLRVHGVLRQPLRSGGKLRPQLLDLTLSTADFLVRIHLIAQCGVARQPLLDLHLKLGDTSEQTLTEQIVGRRKGPRETRPDGIELRRNGIPLGLGRAENVQRFVATFLEIHDLLEKLPRLFFWSDDPAGLRVTHDVADRKSTRLNSSHVAISYAVFCLKK